MATAAGAKLLRRYKRARATLHEMLMDRVITRPEFTRMTAELEEKTAEARVALRTGRPRGRPKKAPPEGGKPCPFAGCSRKAPAGQRWCSAEHAPFAHLLGKRS